MRSKMITPLHLMMLMHHNGIATIYARNEPEHRDSPAVKEYTQDLLYWGLIEPNPDKEYPNPWRTTDKGKTHVHYLCFVPFPR